MFFKCPSIPKSLVPRSLQWTLDFVLERPLILLDYAQAVNSTFRHISISGYLFLPLDFLGSVTLAVAMRNPYRFQRSPRFTFSSPLSPAGPSRTATFQDVSSPKHFLDTAVMPLCGPFFLEEDCYVPRRFFLTKLSKYGHDATDRFQRKDYVVTAYLDIQQVFDGVCKISWGDLKRTFSMV